MTYGSPRLPKLLTATCLVLAAAVLGGCKNDADGVSSAKPQAVETITIALEPAARSWSYAGLVKPRYQSDLGFRVGGKIIERVVDVGREVKSGDVIARLDPRDFEIAIEGQAAEMKAATIARDEATAALERYRVLFNDGHVSKAAFDQRVAAEAEAKSRLERAEHNLELARNQLAYTTLVSDTDGIVSMLPVEKGQVVTTGQLIARVARRDELEVEAALPERDVEAVRNAEAEVEIWGEGRLLPVVVREISPDADPVSRTFRARFALPAGSVAPVFGRTATVHLKVKTQGEVAAVPLSAISNDGSGPVAWVVSSDGTRATPRPVKVALIEKDRVLVSEGLAAGDRIVTLGVHMLDPDKPIRPVETRALISQK